MSFCGPATPGSPCESPGLGFSDFARHYFRNHGCFLFLRVLRWFTSPGAPVHPIDSGARKRCSHLLGFPIRISPDHSLLAAPRSFSQLITSFFAFLRLGIHTHALSSLTIKSTSHTQSKQSYRPACHKCSLLLSRLHYNLCFVMPVKYSVVKDHVLKNSGVRSQNSESRGFPRILSPDCWLLTSSFWWAQVELNHRPHPYQGCALAI